MLFHKFVNNSLLLIQISSKFILHINFPLIVLDFPQLLEVHIRAPKNLISPILQIDQSALVLLWHLIPNCKDFLCLFIDFRSGWKCLSYLRVKQSQNSFICLEILEVSRLDWLIVSFLKELWDRFPYLYLCVFFSFESTESEFSKWPKSYWNGQH